MGGGVHFPSSRSSSVFPNSEIWGPALKVSVFRSVSDDRSIAYEDDWSVFRMPGARFAEQQETQRYCAEVAKSYKFREAAVIDTTAIPCKET